MCFETNFRERLTRGLLRDDCPEPRLAGAVRIVPQIYSAAADDDAVVARPPPPPPPPLSILKLRVIFRRVDLG